jgi:hypothetical protein
MFSVPVGHAGAAQLVRVAHGFGQILTNCLQVSGIIIIVEIVNQHFHLSCSGAVTRTTASAQARYILRTVPA